MNLMTFIVIIYYNEVKNDKGHSLTYWYAFVSWFGSNVSNGSYVPYMIRSVLWWCFVCPASKLKFEGFVHFGHTITYSCPWDILYTAHIWISASIFRLLWPQHCTIARLLDPMILVSHPEVPLFVTSPGYPLVISQLRNITTIKRWII